MRRASIVLNPSQQLTRRDFPHENLKFKGAWEEHVCFIMTSTLDSGNNKANNLALGLDLHLEDNMFGRITNNHRVPFFPECTKWVI